MFSSIVSEGTKYWTSMLIPSEVGVSASVLVVPGATAPDTESHNARFYSVLPGDEVVRFGFCWKQLDP
jgi:hypothetical protein